MAKDKKSKIFFGAIIIFLIAIIIAIYLWARKNIVDLTSPNFIKVTLLPGDIMDYWYYHHFLQRLYRETGPSDPVSVMDHLAYDLRDLGIINDTQFWLAVEQLQAQGVL